MTIIIWIIQLIFVPTVSPLCIGVIKKIKAKFQNRQGASIFQPYKDLWKLFHKDEVISKDASWIFRVAPFIIFTITIIVGASIPLFASFLENNITSDFLFIVYALAIGTFFLALAGMDTGSAFGGFGSSREMTMSALAEGGLIFSLLTVSLPRGDSNLFAISGSNIVSETQFFLPIMLSFIGFFIVLLAETARFPFDNPATHLELTMIHEAMILEYSGKKLALMEWASANKFLIFVGLGSNLFLPFGLAQTADIKQIMMGISFLVIKMFVFCLAIAIIESSMAKYRFFRLPDILLISFILNAVAIGFIK
ncbi:MAG: NADH-quinone oxidoreductase subunit H [Candidatus Peregrinibacteria bacterium]|nr:NADH-quinone oxidoreductase subunit H [Candidatus Peregrinibacteria bacterium]